jgi:uncharacterized ion transporter superfamily protein YfcC
MSSRATFISAAKPTWLALCLLLLGYAWINRNVAGIDSVVLWALVLLTFPIALTLATLGSGVFFLLDRFAGISVPGGFGFNVAFWALSVALAYWFWFGFIPRVTGHER